VVNSTPITTLGTSRYRREITSAQPWQTLLQGTYTRSAEYQWSIWAIEMHTLYQLYNIPEEQPCEVKSEVCKSSTQLSESINNWL